MAYATLAEVKSWLGVSASDTDTLLTGLLAAAQTAVEAVTNRSLEQQTVTEYYWGASSRRLFLRRTPILSVDSVSIAGTPVRFTYDSIAVLRSDCLFGPEDYVAVTYTGGYDPIPADVKLAYQLTVQAMWNAQAMDPNLSGESLSGVFSGSYDAAGPGAVPRAARNLLNNYTARYWSA